MDDRPIEYQSNTQNVDFATRWVRFCAIFFFSLLGVFALALCGMSAFVLFVSHNAHSSTVFLLLGSGAFIAFCLMCFIVYRLERRWRVFQ